MSTSDDSDEFLQVCDLYLEWARDTSFGFMFVAPVSTPNSAELEEPMTGLLIEWRNEDDAHRALEISDHMGILIPGVYRGGGPAIDAKKVRTIWAITLPLAKLDNYLKAVSRYALRIELAAPARNEREEIRNTKARQSDQAVLAAVLDDGCAFANARFRANGTRVIWLWDQNPDAQGPPLIPANGPSVNTNFQYGAQQSKADLDIIYPGAGKAEQDMAYERTGLRTLRRSAAHGTHVMDLLAGAETWDIVFVQFPQAGIDDPTGLWLKRYALDGLLYAIECAGPDTKTIVANLSWGPQTGPHDGRSLLETAIDQLIGEQCGRTLIVSLPAGNSFDAQAHARVDYANGGEFDWIVPPDGSIPAFIELWWPPGVPVSDAQLCITPPVGPSVTLTPGKNGAPDKTWWAKLKMIGPYAKVLLVVHPTGGFPSKFKHGQAGRWHLKVLPNASGNDGDVHAYVARADHNMGARRRARSSYLSDAALQASRFRPAEARHDEATNSAVRRSGTLNGIATGAKTFTAAGYVAPAPDCFSEYSSSGPTRGATMKPDYACLTDRSDVRRGVRAAAVRSGTKTLLIGTSTAAPQLGRMLVKGGLSPKVPSPPHPERVGHGCLPDDQGLNPKT